MLATLASIRTRQSHIHDVALVEVIDHRHDRPGRNLDHHRVPLKDRASRQRMSISGVGREHKLLGTPVEDEQHFVGNRARVNISLPRTA